ncbi:MAG: class I SAM-dependent methyltransferase [Pseudomonadota bacterium]
MNEVTQLKSLEDLGLNLSGDDVFNALRPFVSDLDQKLFAKGIKKQQKKIGTRLWRRFCGIQDEQRHIVELWRLGHARYDIAGAPRKAAPWIWRGQSLLVDESGLARMRMIMIAAVIRELKPRRVLDVGCGDGIYLLLLAGAFPEISFTGIELADTGHQKAVHIQSMPTLPSHLLTYAPFDQRDLEAFRRVNFIHGNACAMPFETDEFDLVITMVSIAQMERIKESALTEIARVTRGHLLSLETFEEVNRSLWRRLTIASRGFFRGKISELGTYHFDPLWATEDFPQEALLGVALVLSRKANNRGAKDSKR